MSPRARRSASLLVVFTALALQGCDLPTGESGRTPLTLTLNQAGPIVIGSATTLEIEAKDPQGRVLVDPPTEWAFPDLMNVPWQPARVSSSGGGEAVLVGQHLGSVTVEVSVSESDRRFTSALLTAEIPVQYSPITVAWVGVGPDTVITARGPFSLKASAVDQDGNAVPEGSFVAETLNRSVTFQYASGPNVWLDATGFGPDTVVVTHTACPTACGDTVTVDIEPVPASIGFPWEINYWEGSLDVPFQLSATVEDANGFEVPGVPIVWHLADSTGILSLVDSVAGTFVAHVNGSTTVQAAAGDLSATLVVYVHQEVATFEVAVPPYVAGVGTAVLARFRGWDPGGTPIDSTLSLGGAWATSDANVAAVTGHDGQDAWIETRGVGQTTVDLTIEQWSADRGSWQLSQSAPLRVIPDPDSVRAYPEAGSTTLSGIGSTATWLGNIYLPSETISAVPLLWASLDPGVATIDEDGIVTAVSVGNARIVGTMGAAADTAVVTVTG